MHTHRRKTLVLVLALALALALALPVARASAGEAEWVRVTSDHFVVYSNAGQKRSLAIAEQLEEFRAMLAVLFPNVQKSEPLVVVAFRNDGDFKPYKPLYNGKPANLSGVYLSSFERDLVALDASSRQSSYRLVFHEYLHRVTSGLALPPWFAEGIAEFYSTATTDGNRAKVGGLVDAHLFLLRERGMMPLGAFFTVQHSSPEYNERDKQGIFYAQAWAFMHYCMLADDLAHQAHLTDFLQRIERGEAAEKAFQAAFGMDLTAAEKQLSRYVRRTVFSQFSLTFNKAFEAGKVEAVPAPRAEVAYQLGSMLALSRRYDDAEQHFRRIRESDPDSPLAYEGLGMIAMRRKDFDGAREMLGAAIERNSTSHLARYYFAFASMPSLDMTTAPRVRKALEEAVSISPSFAEAYYLLASVSNQMDDSKAAYEWARRGLAIAPQNNRLRVGMALALMDQDRLDEARPHLERAIATEEDPGFRRYVESVLNRLERRVAGNGGDGGETALDGLRAAEAGESEVDPTPDASERPHIRMAKAEVFGRLVRLECEGSRMTAVVAVDGREVRVGTVEADSVMLLTQGIDAYATEEIPCNEPLGREAWVQFEPGAGGAETGTLRAIIFAAPLKGS